MPIAIEAGAVLAPPRVQWNHVDGPYLTWACYGHWLTWRQRLKLRLKLVTVQDIANEVWPRRPSLMRDALDMRPNRLMCLGSGQPVNLGERYTLKFEDGRAYWESQP